MAIDRLYSTAEAAEKLGITESLVRRYCRHGRIGTRIGKVWVISADEIRLFKQIDRQPGNPNFGGRDGSEKPRKSA